MQNVLYRIVYAFFYLLSLLPFKVLYLLSDVAYVVVYYVVRYRRRVVRRNLTSAFPDKSEKEIRTIERQFYHWFCDYFNETVKLLSISRSQLLQHIEFRGVEQVEACFDKGQNCSGILGHYCNWEWLSTTCLAFRRYPDAVTGLIYHPLRSQIFDRLFLDMRQSMGGVCIPKRDILRYIVNYKRENRHTLFGYISDQAPKWENIHLWLPFLNHDTPVFTGGERIMRKTNDAVFYLEMQRPRRGHYVCTFKLLTSAPASLPDNEITTRFFQLLEQTITAAPAYYLWSHDRWRRTREEYNHRFPNKQANT